MYIVSKEVGHGSVEVSDQGRERETLSLPVVAITLYFYNDLMSAIYILKRVQL